MTTNWRATFKAAAGVAMTALVLTACSSSKSGTPVGTAAPLVAPGSTGASTTVPGSNSVPSSAPAPSGAASSGSAPPAGSGAPAASAVAIKTTSSKLGTYLTDAAGRALYLWLADTSSASTCTGKCATFWPPLLTSAPATASGGASAGLLGTTKRADGTTQVTYAGHPLYYFLKDTTAGMTTGQGNNGFGAKWWLVTPAGSAITVAAPAAKPSTAAAKPSTAAAKPSTAPAKPSTAPAQPSPPTQPAPSLPSPSY